MADMTNDEARRVLDNELRIVIANRDAAARGDKTVLGFDYLRQKADALTLAIEALGPTPALPPPPEAATIKQSLNVQGGP